MQTIEKKSIGKYISSLNHTRKIKLAMYILKKANDEIELPQELKKEFDARYEKILQNPNKGISLEDFKKKHSGI